MTWFLKMQWFAYMGMAFLLLRVDTTLQYWKSIGFLGHGLILLLHGFAQFVNLVWGKVRSGGLVWGNVRSGGLVWAM